MTNKDRRLIDEFNGLIEAMGFFQFNREEEKMILDNLVKIYAAALED